MFLNFFKLFLEEAESTNFFKKLIEIFTADGVSPALAVAYIIVSILIVLFVIADIVIRIMLFFRYMSTNRVKSKTGKNNVELARELLDKAGLEHIQVKKANFIRAWIWGNSYSLTKKTIFLRRTVWNKDTLTSIGLALQKVGVAKMCNDDSKMAKTRNFFQIVGLFGPFLFVPVVLVGFVLDLLLFKTIGAFSIVGVICGLIVLSAGFIVTLLNIPVEKKANNMALEMIKETGVLDEEETKQVKKVFDTYILAYVLEFIIAVLRIIQLILEILMSAQSGSSRSN